MAAAERPGSVNDGTCWNCKFYADEHDEAHGTCTRIVQDGKIGAMPCVVNIDVSGGDSAWLNVTHDFRCGLYEYEHYDQRGRHPRPLLYSESQIAPVDN